MNKSVDMISLSVQRKLLVCHQFIERTEMGGGSQQIDLELSRIIPGDWGKVESGWLVQPLLSTDRKAGVAEAGFTSSSGSVRALPVNAKKGLRNEER